MKGQWRIAFFFLIVFLVGGGILARLFSLQILQYEKYSALAQGQHQLYQKLFPRRGEIFMHDLSASRRQNQDDYVPLAIDKEFYQVYLVPKKIDQDKKEFLVDNLSVLLNLNKELIQERANKPNDPYEPLVYKVDESIVQEIKELNLEGVGFSPEEWRYYPNGSLACHLVGFVGMLGDEKIGQYGLEGYYEDKLKGQSGFFKGHRDTSGSWIFSNAEELAPAKDGTDLILTIDPNIQFRVEKILKEVVEKWQAEAGTIIVAEPKSGAIRAMANYPVFNPNEYSRVDNIEVFLNSATQKIYEPGSVFKAMTMAAGLDSRSVIPNTTYFDSGRVELKGGVVYNANKRSYGEQTMTQVLEKSLNTGAVFVQQHTGVYNFQEYVRRFNFGETGGIDLSGEVAGDVSNLLGGREIDLANIAFGQGIAVTSLAMTAAFGAIANNGKIMRPFIVEKIVNSDNSEKTTLPEIIRQVISKESAETLTKMLVSVVDNGFSQASRVLGYSIAAKTGTAQLPDLEKGGYSEDETVHNIVAFAPAFNPQFVILLKIDKPKGVRFAETSLGPTLKTLSEYLFSYLEIPPQ